MNSAQTKIMVIVPNGATTDNRVVREAESLKKAGYDILLVGLRLNNTPGSQALTVAGVPVRRIDWQYQAYSRLLAVYAILITSVVLLSVSLLIALVLVLYSGTLEQSMVRAVDGLGQIFHSYGGNFSNLKVDDPLLYHGLIVSLLSGILLVFFIILSLASRVLQRFGISISALAGMGVLARGVRVARNLAAKENVSKLSFIELTQSSITTFLGNKLQQKYVARSRQRGFVEVGLQFRPDIIQCHEVACLPAAIEIKKVTGCRVVYEAHEIYDDLANASKNMSQTHKRIHEDCLPQVDGFVTVNEFIGDYYQKTYSAAPVPVIVPNSVFPKSAVYDGRLHEAVGLPRDAKIVLYQGGFSPKRGMELLLEAAFMLPDDWYVVFMGRGNLEQDLRKQALQFHQKLQADTLNGARPNVGMRVRFAPMAPHSELVEWTSGATVGIIPYENIGLNHWLCSPNKIWEYPNAGVPIIASRLAFLSKVIDTWGIGWTISSDPTASDIVAVVRAITDESLAEKKQACERFIAEDNYLIHEGRLLSLFDSLSTKPSPPKPKRRPVT